MKLQIFAYHDKAHLSDKGYNYEIDIFGVMLLFNYRFFVKISYKVGLFENYQTIKGIYTRFGINADHNMTHLQGQLHYSEMFFE